MDNINDDIIKYLSVRSRSVKDYIKLLQVNLIPFIIMTSIVTALAILYAASAEDIYKSVVTLKITKQPQSILEEKGLQDIGELVSDRFIANEIEVMKNYDIRERYAKALIDSFNNSNKKYLYRLILSGGKPGEYSHKSLTELTDLLKNAVAVEQISGIDVVEISAESPSPYEAALIANVCAEQYREFSLENNKNLLSNIRRFLEKQSKEKLVELNTAEEALRNFKEKGNIVALDAQSEALIKQLSELDAKRDASKVELMTSNEILNQYKNEIKKQDPRLADYLESQTSQAYIGVLQKQIAELQMNRDIVISNRSVNIDITAKVKEYDKKIISLKERLSGLINQIKTNAFASSPEQVKDLSQKLIEEEVNNHSLSIRLKEQESIISRYEQNFNMLPEKSIELSKYERKRESFQQLYLLLEQKYQEAMINELSQAGNVIVVGRGRIPVKPSKPNRIMIIILGLAAGLGSALGLITAKDYFNSKIKSPVDIQKKNLNTLTWIPHFKKNLLSGSMKQELIVTSRPESPVCEAFRTLRTRLLFSGVETGALKTILITSSAKREGKTVVSINLAGCFSYSKKRTMLIDCDLRRPRIHAVMGASKSPGLAEYLSHEATLEEIMRYSDIENFHFITSGILPADPVEMIESAEFKELLEELKNMYDVIILDSPPIVAVVDSEVLSRLTDGTILVVSSNRTETEIMDESIKLIKKNGAVFLGAILNNFKHRDGYYYKYYYNEK